MKSFNNCSIALLSCVVLWGCSNVPSCPFDRHCEKCEKITITAYLPPVVADLDFQYILYSKDQVTLQGGYQHTISVAQQAPNLGQHPFQIVELPTNPVNPITETETIHFGFDSPTITNEELTKLDKFVQAIEKAGLIQIRIEGHTDSTGGISYNEKLSVKRAASVQDYLLLRGVEKTKISLQGFGESKPQEPNDTEAHRAQNRRVTLLPKTEQ
jgi:outer membrane protein OmpA-like peptidoglycan-associated protein